MKKSILAALCALVMVCACLPAMAEEENIQEGGGFRYVLQEDGSAVLLAYISEAVSRRAPEAEVRSVVFQNRVDGHAIADIRQNPFYVEESDFTMLCSAGVMPGHRTLNTVEGVLFVTASHKLSVYPVFLDADTYIVPEDTLIIGAYAFACCEGLQNVVLPEGLTDIETGAFRNCDGLSAVNIPESVTGIAGDAFFGCGKGLTLTVVAGSYGEQFAQENGIAYTLAE